MAGANVFNRLSFSFDTNKFGDAIYLSQTTKNFLNTNPVSLETWQKNDLANGSILATNYYKNPLSNDCVTFKTRTQNLYNTMISIGLFTVPAAQTIIESARTTANNLILEIDIFKSHTDNVSGVTTAEATVPEDGSAVIEYPDYDTAVQLGQDLLMLLKDTDGIEDSTPLLGSMTSLFIKDDLQANSVIILNANTTLSNTLSTITVPGPEGDITVIRSNISANSAQAISNQVNTAYGLINTRREHDWNFFRQGLLLMIDSNKIDKLENVGNTQVYLINNLIGTDSYKQKLTSNTANTNTS
jgi:hypothetical protein